WKEHMSGQEAPSSAKVIAETSHSKGILMWGLSRPRLLSQSFEQSGRSICRGRRRRPLPRVEGAYVGAGGAVLCQEWKEHMSGQEAPSSAKVIAETSHSKGILMWGLSRPRLLSQSFEQSGRSICRGRRRRPLPRVEGAYVGAGGAVLCQEWKEHMSGQEAPSSAKVIAETSHSKGILMWGLSRPRLLSQSFEQSGRSICRGRRGRPLPRVEGAYVGAGGAVLCQEWKEHMSGQEAPSSAKVIAETSHSKGILMWGLSRPRLLSQSFEQSGRSI
ncbi:unnamed protein product, partial [Closterium sp. Naga37s-1]